MWSFSTIKSVFAHLGQFCNSCDVLMKSTGWKIDKVVDEFYQVADKIDQVADKVADRFPIFI